MITLGELSHLILAYQIYLLLGVVIRKIEGFIATRREYKVDYEYYKDLKLI